MADEFLTSQQAAYPDLSDAYQNFSDLHNRKLWHQLTGAVEAFVGDTANVRGNNFIDLESNFLNTFEGKINQLSFVKIAGSVARSHQDLAAAASYLAAIGSEKRARLGEEAYLLLQTEIALVALRRGELDEVKGLLKATKEEVEGLVGAEPVVHSNFYRVAAEYHKQVGPADAYYHNALMFLAYTPVESLGDDEKVALATDMSLAAITGDGVYNFGEVLATPILGALAGTDNAWLSDMMEAFHRGDIDRYNALVAENNDAYYSQPALVNANEAVKEKLALLALMNLVLDTPSHDRTIPFATVAARAKLEIGQVEWLMMRALSLGLIRGTMDEVDQTVSVTYVQPRVLEQAQIQGLHDRIGEWVTKVDETKRYVEDAAPELFV